MPATLPIAFVIGASIGVGQAVAIKLKKEGYKVAVGSREPDTAEAEKNGFLPITVDVLDVTTILNGFKAIYKVYGGPPNVVVFNPSTNATPRTPGEALSLAISDIQEASDIGVGLFASAQHALAGFRELARAESTLPKTFIFTGNSLPFVPVGGPFWDNTPALAMQKRTGAFFLESFAATHEKEGFRFRFADQNNTNGYPVRRGIDFSPEAHAIAYWNVIQGKDRGGWYHRFGQDGAELPGRDEL